ncbi:MAG: ArnT family glycosyltransferase [Myxococcaceae bacterium]
MAEPIQTPEESSFAESLLGPEFLRQPWVKKVLVLPVTTRVVGAIILFAALLFIPYLGAVGLWDPWETHYGEVARSMIERNDYVIPYWESAWFFSKPVFTMWMMAVGMQLAGTNRTEGALSLMTEWGMRLPFALLSILALAILGLALCRTVNKRTGFATVFVLATMPLYFLLARQAVTDTPVVATMICAVGCAIIGQLDDTTRHRSGWWYAFYVFCAFGLLAKGLLGLIPAAVLFVYALLCVVPYDEESLGDHFRWLFKQGLPMLIAVAIPVLMGGMYLVGALVPTLRTGQADIKLIFGSVVLIVGLAALFSVIADQLFMAHRSPPPLFWGQLYRMKLATGILVLYAVAVPWYLKLSLFTGVDDESKDFFTRFFIHDHFNRLGAGVHTTTPGGSFTYFIEQGGYAIFPWVALVPGALTLLSAIKLRGGTKADHVGVLTFVWLAGTWGLIGMSATKFHHYVFPLLPGMALLIGLYIDRLWNEGVSKHALALLMGGVLFMIVGYDLARDPKDFTDLFVYNYDRPYPVEVVTQPLKFFAYEIAWWSELLGALCAASAGVTLLLSFITQRKSALLKPMTVSVVLVSVVVFIVSVTHSVRPPLLLLGVTALLVATYLVMEALGTQSEDNFAVSATAFLMAVAALFLLYRGLAAWLALPGWRETSSVKHVMGTAFFIAGVVAVVALVARTRTLLFGSFGAFALAFALWFNWSHWVDLSHHWTQRDLFKRYYAMRKPDEPIVAFLMNWRGETYYSKNTVKQIKDNARMGAYAAQPGREWALVEHNRLGILRQAVGEDKKVTPFFKDLNNKFILVSIE